MKDLKDMKRVLLKLSGEALAGDKKTGFDEATCADAARQVKTLVDEGLQVAIVIGGGKSGEDVQARVWNVQKLIRSECLRQL